MRNRTNVLDRRHATTDLPPSPLRDQSLAHGPQPRPRVRVVGLRPGASPAGSSRCLAASWPTSRGRPVDDHGADRPVEHRPSAQGGQRPAHDAGGRRRPEHPLGPGRAGLHARVGPAARREGLIRRNANVSTGGTAVDVTDQVHPEVAARAVEAARGGRARRGRGRRRRRRHRPPPGGAGGRDRRGQRRPRPPDCTWSPPRATPARSARRSSRRSSPTAKTAGSRSWPSPASTARRPPPG